MRLRNKNSLITSLPGGTPPPNKASIMTRWFYYLILLSIICFVIYQGYLHVVFFKGLGFVEIEKTTISSSRGGKIIQLPVKEGQRVGAGELIALIEAPESCKEELYKNIENIYFDIELKRSQLGILNNKFDAIKILPSELDFEINQKESRLDLLNRNLSEIKTTSESYGVRRALEVERDFVKDEESKMRDVKSIEFEIAVLSNEIELQHQRSENEKDALVQTKDSLKFEIQELSRDIELQLSRIKQLRGEGNDADIPQKCAEEVLVAPRPAVIQSVSRREHEFAPVGTPIVTLILDDAPVLVESYIDKDELQYIYVNKILEIIFPDGSYSKGLVKTIHSTAYSVPERKWNNYIPASSQIRADLVPVNNTDKKMWHDFDRVELQIRGTRE